MDRPDRFADRAEAGRVLGAHVAEHLRRTGYGARPLIAALPRGGVPVGLEVARASLRSQGPERLLFAAPVCAPQSADLVRRDADTVICARLPARFRAVGQWYVDFTQLDDEHVARLLAQSWSTSPTR